MSVFALICGTAMAKTVTIDFNNDYATLFPTLPGTSSEDSNDGDFTELTTSTPVDGVTVTVSPAEEGKTPNRIWHNGAHLRLYSGTLTFTSADENITKMVFTVNTYNNNNTPDSGVLSPKSGSTVTWTGNAKSVTITIAGNSQFSSVVLTLGESTGEPDEPGTGGEDNPQPGNPNDKTSPYSVEQAIANQGASAWVKGYIVGYIDGTSIQTGAKFEIPMEMQTEILIADTPNETDYTKCLPIQLPAGEIRNKLELYANQDLYKKEVILYGSLEKYFGVSGMKSTSAAIIDGVLIGNDPDNTTPDDPGVLTGAGTLENPYTVADAIIVTSKLASGANSAEKYYIKGKISSIKYTFSADYGTATFDISDEGVNNKFTAYSIFYLENKAWIDGYTQIAIGDDVILYGTVTNYQGNTPETLSRNAYIYSLNGQTKAEGAGISNVNADTKNAPVYNLNGQRVENPKKGLYIIGGKKYLVK